MADNQITDGFDPGDDEKVIEILKKWKGGRISTDLFTIIAKTVPTTCLETVVLRKNEGKIQVLLIPRPEKDPIWKGMLHSPGGALRHADYLREDGNPFKGVFERVEEQEIKNKFVEEPRFISSYPIMTERGPEMVVLFLAKIDENAVLPDGAGWYSVDTLNELPKLIKHQLKAIEEATKAF